MNTQINITISEDRLKAWVTLTKPEEETGPVTAREILDTLRAAGVVHGINEEAVHTLAAAPVYNRKEPVARATPPEKGRDAAFSWLFPRTSEGKPRVLPDGSVDYKQLDIIRNVREGEPVCTKTPPTGGTPGTDVLGGPLEASPGRDMPLPRGKNVVESPDGLQLLARISGQVDLVNNRVTVMDVFHIPENVDYNTGNIDFVGNISVGGDIRAGFSVRAAGNVFVKGNVDGGVIEAGGNVTIANGFNGQTSGKITCGGFLRCKYLQNAHVDVGADLETTSCVNSIVHVGETARFVSSQSVLLASRVTAGKSVEALNIGSRNSTVANIIEVGASPRVAERAASLPSAIKQCQTNIENLNRVITHYQQLEALNRLPDEKKGELARLTATLNNADQELLQLQEEHETIEKRIRESGFGSINVTGAAFAGTRIVIGPESRVLTTDQPFTLFTRAQDGIHTSPART